MAHPGDTNIEVEICGVLRHSIRTSIWTHILGECLEGILQEDWSRGRDITVSKGLESNAQRV